MSEAYKQQDYWSYDTGYSSHQEESEELTYSQSGVVQDGIILKYTHNKCRGQVMKSCKQRSYSAKLWSEWPLEPSETNKQSYKCKMLTFDREGDSESHQSEEFIVTDFDFNEEEKYNEENMSQIYYNEFLPSLDKPVPSQPSEAAAISKLADEVVVKSRKYENHKRLEPSWSTMRTIVISVMFQKNILPSIIPQELEFDISTVKRNSLRYFSTSGLAQFTCPEGHTWQSWGHCYMDFWMKRICYRYTKWCRSCHLNGIPSFSESTFWKMAKSAAWLYLHRTGTSPKRDAIFFMSRMWHEQPSECEPEPTETEIRNVILTAMAEKNITPLDIPREKSFDITAVTMDSLRYFSTKTFAWIECDNGHKRSSIHSWCFVDLKEQQIAYRYELPCLNCGASTKMSLMSDSIPNMATAVVKSFLAKQRRLERRRDGRVESFHSTCTSLKSFIKNENRNYVSQDDDVPQRAFKSITFKMATTKDKKPHFVKPLPEPETSDQAIKEIILKKMKENYLIPSDIPKERKFDIMKFSPWSLRYFRTKGFAILRCNLCKTFKHAVMVCYIDLSDRTICYKVRKSCDLCGNLMLTDYTSSSIEKMASFAAEQFDNLTDPI